MALLRVLACSFVLASIGGTRIEASTPQTLNPLVPLRASGWAVNTHTGAPSFGLPLGTVPGEVPIPVDFGVQGLFRVDRYNVPHYVHHPDGTETLSGYTTLNAFRPAFGTIHFGFIRNAWQSSQYILEPSITVLENGQEYDGATAFSGTLNLPKAYGFATPASGSAMVDTDGQHLFYDTASTGLSTAAASLLAAHLPSGFGTASTTYKVVMDKAMARIFASVPSLGGWVPVVWLDRFGHAVTFQWTRVTTGLPSGVAALSSVVALNAHGKGVEVRWADWSSTTTVQDLARIDFLGLAAPSMLVRGYSGVTSAAPSGFSSTLLSSPPTTTTVVPVSASGGPVGRPTEVLTGDPASVSQPSWNNSGSTPAAQPASTTYSGPSIATRQALLQWDANAAAVLSLTSGIQGAPSSPTRVVSTFTYQSFTYDDSGLTGEGLYAVTAADELDGGTAEHKVTWTRTPSTDPAPTSVAVQDWWPYAGSADHQWIYSSFDATDTPGSSVLADLSGTPWITTSSTATTYASGLGLLNTQTVTVNGADPAQPAQVTLSAANGGGAMTQVQQTVYTYQSRADMLDSSEVTKTVVTRYNGAGTALTPALTLANAYDTPVGGAAPLLQTLKSFQQVGAWQHGGSYTYDTNGRLSTQSIYDSPDNGVTVNTAPQTVTYTYDTAGPLASATTSYANGAGTGTLTQSWSGFDTLGRATTATDARGVSATVSLDLLGRAYHGAQPGRPTVDVTWSGDGQTRTVATSGQTGTDTYDGFGRLVGQVTLDGRTISFAYDANGRISSRTEVAVNPLAITPPAPPRTTSWTYDGLGRVVLETDADGVTTNFTYSLSGLNTVKTAINAATKLKVEEQDDVYGQPVSRVVSDWNTGTSAYVVVKTSAYTYDGAGHATQVVETDPGGVSQTRTFTYDANGRFTGKTEPETGTQTFSSFNALGQPGSVADGVRTRTLAYDGLGRMLSQGSGSDTLSYTYTGVLLTGASTNSSGQTITQAFTYGSAASGALLASESTTTPDFSAAVGYAYTTDGLLQSITYPSGRVVTYGYDSQDRLQTVSQTAPGGGSGGTVATVGYDATWGLESSLQFASGATSVWTTQADGLHLAKWSIQLPGGALLDADRVYGYDGSKDTLNSAGEWSSLTHDARGRLTQATAPTLGNYTATYGYDAFDNNTSASLSGSTPPQAIPFSFPALPKNQTPATSGGSATEWTYDAAGEATNLGAGVGSTPQTGLVWDNLGRLKQVNAPSFTETEGYAPSGMRVRRDESVTANSRRYAYTSGGLLLGEYVPASGGGFQWNRDVIYLGSQAIAEVDASGLHELHSDHLGTPRVITESVSSAATITGRQNYGPYGESFPAMSSGYQPLTGYTGHLQTDPTSLIYMRGRFYTPIWHRFVNSDQGADSNTFNQMAYVSGSPMMRTDPSGRITVLEPDEPGAIVQVDGYFTNFQSFGGGQGGFYDASYVGPLYYLPPPIPSGGWGGGGSLQQNPIQPLSEEKCKALKLMLAQEAQYGTTGMALRQSYILNMLDRDVLGNKGRGNSIYFDDPHNTSPTITTMGPMDLDWFITLKAAANTRVLGIGMGYIGKESWNLAWSVTGDKSGWETPFKDDPGEALAAKAYWDKKKLSDLISADLLKKLCPE